ncbi:hypothetical protein CI102_5430 [Trichoderma harzianum]|uniref:Zn(2)-C6 fungal-type domain-containing protein n=1 Tax=Trichoderma harzianum CBS 226.95 TaxID=983964 RepID=A0A2T3ZYU1_TRIHA|nr:hypothetical protein M431DRAFT_125807 [Trichoderma harzianum CBS 226.95]PKK49661.1 hypothetical protein CI102_5430 [Trichoderma harzianum]PTB49984.1 hypothetical protein M431DRAFT_125807 [Trichoderma harzianum CBS 226.95]
MSTNHSTAGEIAIAEDSLRIWSCVTCRRRKVKCDRKDPCSNCVKNQIECHFPVTGRLPRRRDPAAWKSPTEKQAELLDRLRRLESLVTELAAQVEDGPDKIQSLFTGPLTSATVGELISAMKSSFQGETNEDFGRLVVGKEAGLQIGKGFWSIFCNEVEHIFQGIQDVTSDISGSNLEATSSNSQRQSHSIYSDFYLGNQYTRDVPQSLDALYPLPSQMFFIWRTYVENVVPFINVIDIAAVEEVVNNLRGNFDSLEPSLQALLFAVSLAAITSLDEEETLACFDTPRIGLIARFRLGTERALANAELLMTRKIETIQAFVIYLSLLPYIGSQELLSPFMGLLLRIATSLQLHRDAENFKMPTLTKVEIEIRRRLWWQIIFLDSKSRSKRTAGLSASDTMFDTKTPSHMLEDGKGAFLDPSNAQNQSIVCIIRCEVWLLSRFLNANRPNPLEQKLDAFNRTRSRLETLCMPSVSSNHALTSLVKTMTSLVLSKVEHAIYLQHLHNLKELSQMPSQEMMQHHLDLSIDILKQAHCLRTEPSWKRWRWQLQGDFPWASMSVVFIQLCQSPWSAISEKGWALTHLIFEETRDKVKLSPSWNKLNKLIIAAEVHRGRNPAEGTLRVRSQNKPYTASLINTEESISGASETLVTQSANTHIPLDYPESSQAAFDNRSEIDESNKFESAMAFYPMEWHPWDEGLASDNEFLDFDFANIEESLEL